MTSRLATQIGVAQTAMQSVFPFLLSLSNFNKKKHFLLLFLLQDIGAGKGKYYAVNYPLRDGIDDESYEAIFKPVSAHAAMLLFVDLNIVLNWYSISEC